MSEGETIGLRYKSSMKAIATELGIPLTEECQQLKAELEAVEEH